MRSLFLRIFLWFWVVSAVIVAILVASSPYWTRVRPAVARWEQQAFSRLSERSAREAEVLAEQGVEALDFVDRRRGRRGMSRRFIFDEGGVEVFGQEAPEPVLELVEKVRGSGENEMSRDGFHFFLARPATAPDGAGYTLVLASGRGPHGPWGRPPRPVEIHDIGVVAPRFVAIVLVVGGLCYWLSRYLTSPLRKLRTAARELADGDLSVRVSSEMGSRKDEIGELGRDFDAMAGRLQTLVESQRRLLRDVSHELRSPLARLQVALELARDRSPAEAGEALDRIGLESQRLNELIEQLLTLTRLETGAAGQSHAPFDLVELLREVVTDAGFEAQARGCEVTLGCIESFTVVGIAELMRSAVDNVIRNAVRYTAEGSTVEVACRLGDGGGACVVVRDRGPGVPEEDLEAIFTPFHRVADDRDRASGGVGLGLAIAERAVRLHGGTVRARNHPDGGLELEITLPVRD